MKDCLSLTHSAFYRKGLTRRSPLPTCFPFHRPTRQERRKSLWRCHPHHRGRLQDLPVEDGKHGFPNSQVSLEFGRYHNFIERHVFQRDNQNITGFVIVRHFLKGLASCEIHVRDALPLHEGPQFRQVGAVAYDIQPHVRMARYEPSELAVFVHPFHEPIQAERQQLRLPETVCIDRLRSHVLCPDGHFSPEELFHQYASRSQCQQHCLKNEHPVEAPPMERTMQTLQNTKER